jgi:hypothetical protein
MNKKLVIGITFLSIFILIGAGYQPIIADESVKHIKEYNLRKVNTMRVFLFGKINNLSYYEEYINDTLFKIHSFNCSRVFTIFWYNLFPTAVKIFKDDKLWEIANATSDSFDYYYMGHINDNYICGIQFLKSYSDEIL